MTPIALAINIILILVLFAIAVFLFLFLWAELFTRAPFVPMPKKFFSKIIEALKIKEGSVVYDLGCGDGRVLIECHNFFPSAKYVGFEKDTIPYLFARMRLALTKKSGAVDVRMKNFFNQDLSGATHIFTYLFPNVMDQLLPKLQKELKPKTRLVTCDFIFKGKEAAGVVDLGANEKDFCKKLYVYKF